jgi:hypothetical protein
MASTDEGSAQQSGEQCIALTEGGERCGREAADGQFCYQHDEDDPTVDDTADDPQATKSEDADDQSDEESSDSSGQPSVLAVRSAVADVTSDLIGRPLDGIIEVGKTDDGWRAVVEVVERRAVPDTQDILGRYELTLDDSETVTGYRRLGRSRRADTGSQE